MIAAIGLILLLLYIFYANKKLKFEEMESEQSDRGKDD
jgi:hypothetical protein